MHVDLTRLAPLPKGIRPDYYRNCAVRPLLIRAHLVTPYVPIDSTGRLNLDGILASAFYKHLPFPVTFGEAIATAPLPLKCLWISPEGLPLWACSQLLPQGDVLRSREYWHKRYPAERAEWGKRLRADMRAGASKEYRTPLQTVATPELRAVALGDLKQVQNMLDHISHVGKKNSQGFGRVAEWLVAELNNDEAFTPGLLIERPVPTDYLLEQYGGLPLANYQRMGWTAPNWYAPYWRVCRAPG